MTYRIETRNCYLRVALERLEGVSDRSIDTCIIDLASFRSLTELIRIVSRNETRTRFIFIGNCGSFSYALASLVSVDSKASLRGYYEKLRHCPGVSYGMAMTLLINLKTMANLTHKDMATVHSLLLNDSMKSAAGQIGTSPKLFYQRVDTLVKKMNMLNRLQTQLFLRLEFRPDYVQERINEHVRLSVRRQLGQVNSLVLTE
ncbi:hypothetical protein ACRQQF_16400 [Citrobacter arsenatis]|uniref:Uncharacterized protein n=1 Tax=Citrobacter arsenatis TaxID=2546350 RepID=A0A4P6WNC9_9ENTR|nr:hypothetical protein [Citrobacter arsenatis]QBM23255.1 hypothetical protein E1B03_12790 [Citrobacter arsenatis]